MSEARTMVGQEAQVGRDSSHSPLRRMSRAPIKEGKRDDSFTTIKIPMRTNKGDLSMDHYYYNSMTHKRRLQNECPFEQAIKYSTIKLICFLVILASTVPKTVVCLMNANNHQFYPMLPQKISTNATSSANLFSQQHDAGNLRNHRLFNQPEFATPSVDSQRRYDFSPQQQQLQYQQMPFFQQTVRPAKLLTEYVANQGQRILKNLVNTSIADLVAQSTNKIINSNRNAQQVMLNGQFPAVGKLYTLLFPTIQPQMHLAMGSSARNPSFLSNQSGQQTYPRDGQQNSNRDQRNQMVSLSAPYDPRPRASAGIGRGAIRIRGERVQLPDESSAGDWRGGKPSAAEAPNEIVMQQDQNPSMSLYHDQQMEPAALASDGAEVSVRDLESDAPINAYEGADLSMQQQQGNQDRKVYSGGPSQVQEQVAQSGDAAGDINQLGGDANVAVANHEPDTFGSQPRFQSEDTKVPMSELQFEELSAASNQTSGVDMSSQPHHDHQFEIQESVDPHSSGRQPESLPEPQHQLAMTYVNEDGQTIMQPLVTGEEQASNETRASADNLTSYANNNLGELNNDPRDFKSRHNRRNTTNHAPAQASDENSFTLHLPSQYDSDAIRMPPEGYYDDYFKPTTMSSSLPGSAPTPMPPPSSATASLLNQDSYGNPQEMNQHPANDGKEQSYEQYSGSRSNYMPQPSASIEYVKPQYTSREVSSSYSGDGEQQRQHQLEYMTHLNKSHHAPDRILQSSNYELQLDQRPPDHINSELSTPNRTADQIMSRFQTFDGSRVRNNDTGLLQQQKQQQHQQKEDNIQVIIANTSNNLKSNEKVIHYTSEGQNITRGKSPRNNFINKDMNEFPPDGSPLQLVPTANPTLQGDHLIVRQTPDHPQLHLSPQSDEFARPQMVGNQQRQSMLVTLDPSNSKRHLTNKLSEHSREQVVSPATTTSAGEQDMDGNPREQGYDRYTPPELKSLQPEPASGYKRDELLPSHRHQNRLMESTTVSAAGVVDGGSEDESLPQPAPSRLQERDEQVTEKISIAARNRHRHQAPTYNTLVRGDDRRSERRARQRSKFSRQQTMPRPQVTQVNLEPKELVLKEPTPQPSRNPIDTVVELPAKVQRLREKQPDKNELMNELLTALDRVKVAIYKLQPLTAKMNAIYRKSVTSNTRDIVMDNHKGTYAKRYPPGDYDDSYDRMHPSELLNRHPASNQIQTRKEEDEQESPAVAHQQVADPKQPEVDGSESAANAVYLPAPREILEKHKREMNESRITATFEIDLVNSSGGHTTTKIVPDGLGRRSGESSFARGQLSVTSGERIRYDDDDQTLTDEDTLASGSIINATHQSATGDTHTRTTFFPGSLGAPQLQSLDSDNDTMGPLFGYRITIYQAPTSDMDGSDSTDDLASQNEQYTYQVDGIDRLGDELSSNYSTLMNRTSEGDTLDLSEEDELSGDRDAGDEVEDAMATSESSLVESAVDPLDKSESGQKHRKKIDGGSNERKSSEGEDKKRGNKSKKSQSKRKRNEEESKKSREYKKIKHNKGLISKERKSMHRDKRVKAHDRGAAKEKALKERTQIEFFEREQIIDDEFEKGKKNTVKAGWQSGHDAKKSLREGHGAGGDTMSSGGSHFVKHEPKEGMDKSGLELSAEASRGKKSNKFERKQMEAKGKKFKGWREKGYKIITETEFIDRGSLHDSAYKKRDKGSAQHQKFKKQEASSEGHHGSMQEQHRKSAKKEEKRSKMRENKEKGAKFTGAEKRDKKRRHDEDLEPKKAASKRVTAAPSEPEIDHSSDDQEPVVRRQQDAEQDAEQGESTLRPTSQPEESEVETAPEQELTEPRKRQIVVSKRQPLRSSISPSTTRPHFVTTTTTTSRAPVTEAPMKLIMSSPVNHEQPTNRQTTSNNSADAENNAPNQTRPRTHENANSNRNSNQASSGEQPVIVRYQLLNDTSSSSDTMRRNDGPSTPNGGQALKSHRSNATSPYEHNAKSNSTILDIFENLTGRQINKTRIGTYDVEDHHVIKVSGEHGAANGTQTNARASNNPTPLGKIGNSLAKYLPFLSQQTTKQQQAHSNQPAILPSGTITTTTSTTTTTTTTKAPNSSHQPRLHARELTDGRHTRHKPAAPVLQNHNLNPISHQNALNNHKGGHAHRSSGHMTITHNEQTHNNLALHHQGGPQATTFTPPTNYITHEQAEAAAQLLQIVQRANQANHHQVKQVNLMNHQPTNHMMQMNEHHMRLANAPMHHHHQQATFLSPTIQASAFQQPQSVFDLSHQLNFGASPPTGPNTFSPDQFVDYDHEPHLHQATHNFLTD